VIILPLESPRPSAPCRTMAPESRLPNIWLTYLSAILFSSYWSADYFYHTALTAVRQVRMIDGKMTLTFSSFLLNELSE
jgi:hypothetical protein